MGCRKPVLTRSELVARRFGARAEQYDEHALLQRETAAHLAAFVTASGGLPKGGLVAEVGCGTGLLTGLLAPQARRYLATDIAPEMLARCRQRLGHLPHLAFAVLDGEGARFPEAPAALVSNLTAQWFQNPLGGLAHLAGQAGLFAFSVPLSGSFPEWETAFRDLGRKSGLLPLPEEKTVKQALSSLPSRSAAFHVEHHVIHFPDARAFADSFRNIGADQPRPGYRPAPIRAVLERFARGMDATVQVLYGLIRQEGA